MQKQKPKLVCKKLNLWIELQFLKVTLTLHQAEAWGHQTALSLCNDTGSKNTDLNKVYPLGERQPLKYTVFAYSSFIPPSYFPSVTKDTLLSNSNSESPVFDHYHSPEIYSISGNMRSKAKLFRIFA